MGGASKAGHVETVEVELRKTHQLVQNVYITAKGLAVLSKKLSKEEYPGTGRFKAALRSYRLLRKGDQHDTIK
jgi:hypothetical protein